jgi:hypothetical protein
MKRALLIAGGTVGGLGAVLAITPPQITSTQDIGGLAGSLGGGTQATQSNPVAAATSVAPEPAATTPTASPSKAAATKSAQVTSKPSAAVTHSASSTPAPTPTKSAATTPTPTATKTTAAPSSGGYSGSVTGASFSARNYGTLSATVTFSNGKITNVSASQSPVSWAQRALTALIPYVNAGSITVEQIKQYSVTQLPCSTGNSCRSQASFTAEAFWSSVKSAISKAGL